MNPDRRKRQEELLTLFKTKNDEITRSLDVKLAFDSQNQSIMTVPECQLSANPIGGISGAVLAYLVDYTGWFTAAQFYEGWVSTIDFRVDCLKPSKPLSLKSVAKVTNAGKRIALCQTEIFDYQNDLIAIGTASYTASNAPYKAG